MPALNAQHLRKSFGSHAVLDDATLTLGRGERIALIGANGAGKSTFARILAGLEQPDSGTLSVRRGLSVRYLAQEPVLDAQSSAIAVVEDALTSWRAATARHAALTARLAEGPRGEEAALLAEQAALDDTVMRLGGWDRGHEALGFLQRLGVRDVERPCGARSGGERRRIALAQLLVASPDVAILDEPTNHLDADTAAWLEEFLADEFGGAVVLVTHDRYFLDAVAERIVELEGGQLTSFEGGYGDYLEKKADREAHAERVERNRQNILRREREWLARGPKARSTKQKARIARAQALEAGGARPGAGADDVEFVGVAAPRQGKTILELKGVSVAPGAGLPALHRPLDLVVCAGERIGIVGPNGVGKTTLLLAILRAAQDKPESAPADGGPQLSAGQIAVGKNTRVCHLDQARDTLDRDKTVFDDVRGEGGGGVIDLGQRGREALDLRTYLELFLFDANKQRQKVSSLSGGERARVALAKAMRQGANLLLFDEPTNDLDLPTLAALEELLLAFEGSALIVTHDRALLDRIATAILAFEPDPSGVGPARVVRYAGGYQDYLMQRAAPPVAPAVVPASPPAPPAPAKGKTKGGLSYAERLELEQIVPAIDAAEGRVGEVEALLADPTLYAKRGHEVAGLQARLAAARAQAAELVARWEALETKKSG